MFLFCGRSPMDFEPLASVCSITCTRNLHLPTCLEAATEDDCEAFKKYFTKVVREHQARPCGMLLWVCAGPHLYCSVYSVSPCGMPLWACTGAYPYCTVVCIL